MIKKFITDDFQKCCEVFVQTYNQPPWNDRFTFETARIFLQELLDNKRFTGFTLWENNLLIGFAFCHIRYNWRGDSLTIDILCIAPEYQRKGYGKILMGAVEELAKETSCNVVTLSTSISAPAFNFYEKLGYKHWESEVSMYKDIT